MENKKKEILEWLVHFIQLDLDNLRPGDRAKLAVDSTEYLFPLEEIQEIDKFLKEPQISINFPIIPLEKINRETLRQIKKNFPLLPKMDSPEFWSKIGEAQKIVHKALTFFFLFGAGRSGKKAKIHDAMASRYCI